MCPKLRLATWQVRLSTSDDVLLIPWGIFSCRKPPTLGTPSSGLSPAKVSLLAGKSTSDSQNMQTTSQSTDTTQNIATTSQSAVNGLSIINYQSPGMSQVIGNHNQSAARSQDMPTTSQSAVNGLSIINYQSPGMSQVIGNHNQSAAMSKGLATTNQSVSSSSPNSHRSAARLQMARTNSQSAGTIRKNTAINIQPVLSSQAGQAALIIMKPQQPAQSVASILQALRGNQSLPVTSSTMAGISQSQLSILPGSFAPGVRGPVAGTIPVPGAVGHEQMYRHARRPQLGQPGPPFAAASIQVSQSYKPYNQFPPPLPRLTPAPHYNKKMEAGKPDAMPTLNRVTSTVHSTEWDGVVFLGTSLAIQDSLENSCQLGIPVNMVFPPSVSSTILKIFDKQIEIFSVNHEPNSNPLTFAWLVEHPA